MSMLLFSLLNLRITKNAVNIGTYSLEFPVVIFEIMVFASSPSTTTMTMRTPRAAIRTAL